MKLIFIVLIGLILFVGVGYASNLYTENMIKLRSIKALMDRGGYTKTDAEAKVSESVVLDIGFPYRVSDRHTKGISRDVSIGYYFFGYRVY